MFFPLIKGSLSTLYSSLCIEMFFFFSLLFQPRHLYDGSLFHSAAGGIDIFALSTQKGVEIKIEEKGDAVTTPYTSGKLNLILQQQDYGINSHHTNVAAEIEVKKREKKNISIHSEEYNVDREPLIRGKNMHIT